MRITGIADIVVPISSPIRNAFIDFSAMNVSVLAVFTDKQRGGKPVVGYGFNWNGRYAQQALLRERFIPRLVAAKPEDLQDADGLLDPGKCWAAMMQNEKPGGHGERSVAIGVLDMAIWDAVAKAEDVPVWKLLADRHIGGADLATDLKRIEAVLALLGGNGQNLCVDANGRFDRKTALEYGHAIAPFNLRWYEGPGDPLDFRM